MNAPGYIVQDPNGKPMVDHYGAAIMFRDHDDASQAIASNDAYLNCKPVPLVRWVRPRAKKQVPETALA